MSEGQCYDSKEQMKNAIARWHIEKNKEIRNTHNDKERLRFKCKNDRCVCIYWQKPLFTFMNDVSLKTQKKKINVTLMSLERIMHR